METFYALRYLATVPLKKRKHGPTVGRFETWIDAEDERLMRHGSDLLEVVTRSEGGAA